MTRGETLEQGRPPQPVDPHRRRRQVVAAVVLLAVAAVALVVDRDHRKRESDEVAGCVAAATSSTRYAHARLTSVLGYVHPVLDSGATGELRRAMDRVVSGAVRPVVPDVRRARDRCAAADVLPWHGRLVATRDDCRALVDRDLALLTRVVEVGTRGLRPEPAAGRCRR